MKDVIKNGSQGECQKQDTYDKVESKAASVETPTLSNHSERSEKHSKDSGSDRHSKSSHHHHSKHHHKHSHHKHRHRSRDRHSSPALENTAAVTNQISSEVSTESPKKHVVLQSTRDEITHTIRISGKKRIVNNCGVQVNLRRRTENKSVQAFSSKILNDTAACESEKSNKDFNIITPSVSSRIGKVSRGIQTVENPHIPLGSALKDSCASPLKYLSDDSKTIASPVKSASANDSKKHSSSKEHSASSVKGSGSDTPRKVKYESSFDLQLKSFKHSADPVVCLQNSRYRRLFHLEKYSNGGALVLHAYQREVNKLEPEQQQEFVKEFFDFVYGEPTEGVSNCVMGIVHGAMSNQPDFIDYLADKHSEMVVKAGMLGKSDIETMTMTKYKEQLDKAYQAGTCRCGPLLQISMVGTVHEEVGGYFPDFLDMLESNIFLHAVMPWGKRSVVPEMPRNRSNDGPILWARPGEQMVPTADLPKSPFKRKR